MDGGIDVWAAGKEGKGQWRAEEEASLMSRVVLGSDSAERAKQVDSPPHDSLRRGFHSNHDSCGIATVSSCPKRGLSALGEPEVYKMET